MNERNYFIPKNRPDLEESEPSVETREVNGLAELAELVYQERPAYIHIPDAHFVPDPQQLSLALLKALKSNPRYLPGEVGFYVEALFSDANPQEGNYSSGLIAYDENGQTKYRETLEQATALDIPPHGIDLNKRIDQEGEERMSHWVRQIEKGTEPIKVLLIGAGHIWNNPKKTPDLMYRLDGKQWVIENTRAYKAPGYSGEMSLHLNDPSISKADFVVLTYEKAE